ncbi:MAG TPA: hypothetical protein VME43_09635 [Bryobacteraceae bacterium]|nr:hypothetical protein [Bryobacteraceae bacterium]
MTTLAGSAFLLMSLTASAQYLPRQDYQDQVQANQGVDQQQNLILNRIRTDLDGVRAGTMPFTPSRDRVIRAQERVNACQRALNTGTYDRRTFDDTISALQTVVDANHLTDQSQHYLRDDIRDLSRLEARLEG